LKLGRWLRFTKQLGLLLVALGDVLHHPQVLKADARTGMTLCGGSHPRRRSCCDLPRIASLMDAVPTKAPLAPLPSLHTRPAGDQQVKPPQLVCQMCSSNIISTFEMMLPEK
jgi:hypothetical protein